MEHEKDIEKSSFQNLINNQDKKLETLAVSIQGIREKSYIIQSEMDCHDK